MDKPCGEDTLSSPDLTETLKSETLAFFFKYELSTLSSEDSVKDQKSKVQLFQSKTYIEIIYAQTQELRKI